MCGRIGDRDEGRLGLLPDPTLLGNNKSVALGAR